MYSQSSGHFYGTGFDGSYIDTYGCSGQSGSCRNNPSCQCQGIIWIGLFYEFVWLLTYLNSECRPIASRHLYIGQHESLQRHELLVSVLYAAFTETLPCSYSYDLYPAASNSMCGRSGFLIHGGSCSGNPSEGRELFEYDIVWGWKWFNLFRMHCDQLWWYPLQDQERCYSVRC